MLRIPKQVASKIGYYVYLYINPRSGRIFYVGKGKKSRALKHLQAGDDSRKVRILSSLRRAGLKPRIDILAHGIHDAETALRIEAAAIDLLGMERLANIVRGGKSLELGRMPLRSLIAYYRPRPVKVTHPVLLIRINRLYSHGMTKKALYEATRGCWRLNRDRATRCTVCLCSLRGHCSGGVLDPPLVSGRLNPILYLC